MKRVAMLVAVLVGAAVPATGLPAAESSSAGASAADKPAAPPKTGAKVPGKKPGRKPLVIEKVPKDQQICFCLYTVQNGVLKLTAQLYPLEPADPREVRLEVRREGSWRPIARATVRENEYNNARWKHDGQSDRSWVALFRVEGWDAAQDVPYRVRHGDTAVYEGLVRRDPIDKEEIVVGAFTGNGNNDRRLRPDVVANLKAQNPDLLFFSGDQVYDHTDHLYAWLLFGRQFGEITRDRPTICIPDDHDVGHGNLWGAAGKASASPAGDDGGYFMPVEYVNEVQFAQTANLPDPIDPTPVQRGITVYYTALNVGRVSFAILEDRKWKTGPNGLVPQRGPRPDHVNDPAVDPKTLDVPGAELLGQRQVSFLRTWGQDWRSADLKVVLSQTIFSAVPHLHHGQRLIADLDSNSWPQTGRNRALEEMRRSFAFHIGGDQHLATVVRYGIDTWDDAGWAFCVPSIVNYYPRAWEPLERPHKAIPTALPKTGQYRDGLGNPYTILAYANPDPARDKRWGGEWGAKADGYGLVRLNTRTRKITMECWPRGVDVRSPQAEQYPGWPITIDQADNGPAPAAWLPELKVRGPAHPVVQVLDSNAQVIYTLRISGQEFRPPVYKPGRYRLKIMVPEQNRFQTLDGLEPLKPGEQKQLEVTF